MNSHSFTITKRDITAALRTSAPIMVTFLVLGSGYGILMQKHGFGPLWSLLSGIVIFSGTVQFVSVSMLGSGSLVMAAVTALMVAARHIFFSISMIGRYKAEGKRKWYLYYALCDETYAMLREADHSASDACLYIGSINDVEGQDFLWNLGGSTPAELLEAKTPVWQGLLDTFNGK